MRKYLNYYQVLKRLKNEKRRIEWNDMMKIDQGKVWLGIFLPCMEDKVVGCSSFDAFYKQQQAACLLTYLLAKPLWLDSMMHTNYVRIPGKLSKKAHTKTPISPYSGKRNALESK